MTQVICIGNYTTDQCSEFTCRSCPAKVMCRQITQDAPPRVVPKRPFDVLPAHTKGRPKDHKLMKKPKRALTNA